MEKIIIKNNKECQLQTENEEVVKKVKKLLSFKASGVEYTQAYKNGWNGVTYLLSNKGTFGLGLLNHVINNLPEFEFEIVDNRKNTFEYVPMNLSKKLESINMVPREHQLRCLDAARKNNKGILRSATGSGKSLIAAMIAAEFNESTIIYVIGLDLLQQFHNLFSKIFDEEIGWIGNGIVNPKRITIASIWSLGSSLDFKKTLFLDDEATKELPASLQDKKKILECLKSAKTHIIDECHACTCDTIQSIYKFIDPKRIYGLSGTPYRDDGSDLLVTSLLGEIIEDVSASELIEKKILTEPIIKFVMVPHQNIQVRTYNEVYKEYIVCNEYRNNMILSQSMKLIEKGYKVLVLFKTIDHGKMLLDMFRDKDVNCDLLNGNDSLDKRNEVKAKLEAGNLDCLIASTILDIGFDAPILSALVLAGAGKSKIRALQRIGRIIRFHPSKKRCAVVDFMDNCRFLDKHSKIRYETYKQESGFKILGS